MNKLAVFIWVLSSIGLASTPQAGFSSELIKRILKHNQSRMQWGTMAVPGLPPGAEVAAPYAEYEPAKYFFMSGDISFNSQAAKETLLREMPPEVSSFVLVNTEEDKNRAFQNLPSVDRSRFTVLNLNTSVGFWARDNLPVPVYLSTGGLALVDAKYAHGNEPDQSLASFFGLPLLKHSFYYEGGNFLADKHGTCVTVNHRTESLSDEFFKDFYGCKKMIRLPFVSGIGHVDEHAKFISNGTVLTDLNEYVPVFVEAGYQVTLLPRPEKQFETYVNSLLVNGTVFVPQYDEASDAEALKVYQGIGYKVFGLPSKQLSNSGLGSIHCITMTYPEFKAP